MSTYQPDPVSRVIGVEEHFITQPVLDGPASVLYGDGRIAGTVAELLDIGAGRIAAMDRANIDMQVLSLSAPGVEPLEPNEAVAMVRQANDTLIAAVAAHPTRFAGLAALPMSAPQAAADELDRVIGAGFSATGAVGLAGAVVNGHSRGRYLDDPFFEPILAAAQRLDVPIYLHPTLPPAPVIEASYRGNFSAEIGFRLAGAGWGWHHETGTHALRMILGGVFDRFPRLQVMLGHHGEAIPLLLPRIERNFPQRATGLRRTVREYLQQNFSYTFGGWNWDSMLTAVRRLVPVDRILFSTDYPFGALEEARSFLDRIEVSAAERELIAHGNAERLLNLPPVATSNAA